MLGGKIISNGTLLPDRRDFCRLKLTVGPRLGDSAKPVGEFLLLWKAWSSPDPFSGRGPVFLASWWRPGLGDQDEGCSPYSCKAIHIAQSRGRERHCYVNVLLLAQPEITNLGGVIWVALRYSLHPCAASSFHTKMPIIASLQERKDSGQGVGFRFWRSELSPFSRRPPGSPHLSWLSVAHLETGQHLSSRHFALLSLGCSRQGSDEAQISPDINQQVSFTH